MTDFVSALGRPAGTGGWTLALLLDDLEQQASGHAHALRDEEVAELQLAHYAEVDLLSRLHGSAKSTEPGSRPVIDLRLLGGGHLRGGLKRVGADFLVIELQVSGVQWAVALGAVASVSGLGTRALHPEARPLTARLGLRSVFRELADQGAEVALLLRDGGRAHGEVLRVGADFVELATTQESTTLVPFDSLAALSL